MIVKSKTYNGNSTYRLYLMFLNLMDVTSKQKFAQLIKKSI